MKADLVIVGGGPAGISAAIEARRWGLETLLFEKRSVGGSLEWARMIENYPPISPVSGPELSRRFEEAFSNANIDAVFEEVKEIHFHEGGFRLNLSSGHELEASAVIVATGQKDVVPEEYLHLEKFIKLSRDLMKEDVRGRDALVYGGGDVAFDMALHMDDLGGNAAIFCRNTPKAKSALLQEAEEKGIAISPGCRLKDLGKRGSRMLAVLEDRSGKCWEVECDSVFFALGKIPALPIISAPQDVPGLFFAGDVVRGKNRNVGVAVGDGISAAFNACRFLMGDKDA